MNDRTDAAGVPGPAGPAGPRGAPGPTGPHGLGRWFWLTGIAAVLVLLLVGGLTGYVISSQLQLATTARLAVMTADQVVVLQRSFDDQLKRTAYADEQNQGMIRSLLYTTETLKRAVDELRAEVARQGAGRR
jgi:hypothetical protein